MKKYKFSVLGMLAVVVALGIVLVGCKTDSDDEVPKSFKVIGINKTGITTTALINIISNDDSLWANGQVAEGEGEIVSQVLSVDLYNSSEDGRSEQLWIGNGEWTIRLKFRDNDDNHQLDYFWKGGQKYNIKDAVTELNFADFVLVWEEGK